MVRAWYFLQLDVSKFKNKNIFSTNAGPGKQELSFVAKNSSLEKVF